MHVPQKSHRTLWGYMWQDPINYWSKFPFLVSLDQTLCSKIWRPCAHSQFKKLKNYLTITYFLVKRNGLMPFAGVFEIFAKFSPESTNIKGYYICGSTSYIMVLLDWLSHLRFALQLQMQFIVKSHMLFTLLHLRCYKLQMQYRGSWV